MQPILADLDLLGVPITLRAYGTLIVVAALVAVGLAVRGARSIGVRAVPAAAWYGLAVVAGLVGARSLDVTLNWQTYAGDPAAAFHPGFQGFALYGGLLPAAGVMMIAARRWRVSGWALADSAVPAVVAGIVLVRVGCFLNGCCAGVATDLPWGVRFPFGTEAWAQALGGGAGASGVLGGSSPSLHPTQLYEAGAALLCGAIAGLVRRRTAGMGWAAGSSASVFAAGFLVFRAANQVLRPGVPGATLPREVLVGGYLAAGLLAAVVAVRLIRSVRAGEVPGSRALAAGPPPLTW